VLYVLLIADTFTFFYANKIMKTKISAASLNNHLNEAYSLSEKYITSFIPNQKIIAGSDEHLDLINSTKINLDKLVKALAIINDEIEENFPNSLKEIESLKKSLQALYMSLNSFLKSLKRYNLLKSHLQKVLKI
jgi:hypothetical protein